MIEERRAPDIESLVAEHLASTGTVGAWDDFQVHATDLGPERCHREISFRLNGEKGDPRAVQQLALMESGKIFEDWISGIVRGWYGKGQCERNKKVNYCSRCDRAELGALWKRCKICGGPFDLVGHMDMWVPTARVVYEFKEVKEGGEKYLPKADHLSQLQVYLKALFLNGVPDPEGRLVYGIRGQVNTVKSFTVKPSDEQWERAQGNLRRLLGFRDGKTVASVAEGMAPDTFPCFWETRGKGAYQVKCRFWDRCWAGAGLPGEIQYPPLAEAEAVAGRLMGYEERVKALKKEVEEAEEKRDVERTSIGLLMDRLGVDAAVAGGVSVKRVFMGGKVTYAVEEAIGAGAVDREAIEPFKRVGGDYLRWYVKRSEPKTSTPTES